MNSGTEQNPTKLTPRELVPALITCFDAQQPVCVWGEPGIGKSDIMEQVAQATSRQFNDQRAVLLDPVDVRGLPTVVNGRSTWATPDFLPTTGRGVLFLDELNRAATMVQNAFLQLVLDRRLGDYTLPGDWVVAAACNRSQDGGGVTKMNSALSSRFLHLELEPTLDDWCKWAVTHNIEPAVIAFLRFRPELLHKFDRNARSFPNCRSWEFVSRVTAQNPSKNVELALFEGVVGHGAAIEFAAFLQLFRNIPSIDSILLNPDKAAVPVNDAASLWAIASALSRRATDANFRRVLTYLERMPGEYNVLSVKDATARDQKLCATPEFTTWMINHSDVVF